MRAPCRSTDVPQDRRPRHLFFCEVLSDSVLHHSSINSEIASNGSREGHGFKSRQLHRSLGSGRCRTLRTNRVSPVASGTQSGRGVCRRILRVQRGGRGRTRTIFDILVTRPWRRSGSLAGAGDRLQVSFEQWNRTAFSRVYMPCSSRCPIHRSMEVYTKEFVAFHTT